jgi:hypothetical protein
MNAAEKRDWVLTDVTLMISGGDLQPEEITSLLGIQPTGARNPGPSKWARPGDVDGLWSISCNEHVSRDFHEQMDNILSIMESKRTELAQLSERGYGATVEIYGFAGNDCTIALEPEELKRIAVLGFPLRVAANMNER